MSIVSKLFISIKMGFIILAHNLIMNFILNNKGNITILSLILIQSLSLGTLINIASLKNGLEDIINRSQVYLCQRFINIETTKYIKEINYKNIVLQGSLQEKLIQDQINIQNNYYHLLKNNDFCLIEQIKDYLKNDPYRNSIREQDFTLSLEAHSWINYISHKKESFSLKSYFSLKNNTSPDVIIKTNEVPWSSKHRSGSMPSFSSLFTSNK